MTSATRWLAVSLLPVLLSCPGSRVRGEGRLGLPASRAIRPSVLTHGDTLTVIDCDLRSVESASRTQPSTTWWRLDDVLHGKWSSSQQAVPELDGAFGIVVVKPESAKGAPRVFLATAPTDAAVRGSRNGTLISLLLELSRLGQIHIRISPILGSRTLPCGLTDANSSAAEVIHSVCYEMDLRLKPIITPPCGHRSYEIIRPDWIELSHGSHPPRIPPGEGELGSERTTTGMKATKP